MRLMFLIDGGSNVILEVDCGVEEIQLTARFASMETVIGDRKLWTNESWDGTRGGCLEL